MIGEHEREKVAERAHLEQRIERKTGRSTSEGRSVERVADREDGLEEFSKLDAPLELVTRLQQDRKVGLELLHVEIELATV